ncbi:FitA-like ribbon-helix-helix domain-containing protein [Planctomicrobium piriforme]|nr:hypothetical protein [Planctomicrobium piriforme]
MASLTIRNLPDQAKEALRVHAAQSGFSLEAYARHILQAAAQFEGFPPIRILDLAEKHFGSQGGINLDLPPRRSKRA